MSTSRVLGVLAATIFLFFIWNTRHVDAGPRTADPAPDNISIPGWPTIAHAPPPEYKERIALPELPPMPMTYRSGLWTQTPWAVEVAEQRLDILVAAHPDELFRERFTKARQSGELAILWTDNPVTNPAVFMLREVDGQLQPSLLLSVYALGDADTWEEKAEILNTLSHEWRHYVQASSEHLKERQDHVEQINVTQSPETCAHRWRDEREAYHLEAVNSFAWGYSESLDPLRVAVNTDAAFDQRLFLAFAVWYSGAYPECMNEWARLSGHP